MYLTFDFPSDTNEQWFLDYIDNEYAALKQHMYRKGGVVHLAPGIGVEWMSPEVREEITKEAEQLGAIVSECK